jgi:hypothetical protein
MLHLDNGQVWEAAEDSPDLNLRAGDTVKIEKGAFGSYWLSGRSNVVIKVRLAK